MGRNVIIESMPDLDKARTRVGKIETVNFSYEPSKELVDELIGKLNDEMHLDSSKKYACLINGMGATPLMEQYIFANDVLNKLETFGIEPSFMKVGNYMTSIDMAGISLTLFEIQDDKWLDYLNYPVKTIAW